MKTMWNIVKDATDWVSVKLTGACVPFLFIDTTKLTAYLGVAVMASTLLYNGVRIVKEFMNKK